MKASLATWGLTAALLCSRGGWAQNPTLVGPFTVLTASYDHGDTAFSCPAAQGCEVPSAEIRAEVYYPSNLAAGPFPLLVFLHGRHAPCYNPVTGDADSSWPCNASAGFIPIPSHRGYDYIGRLLASHGYIVASISANGINAQDGGATNRGIFDRARLIDAHLNLWAQLNSVGSAVDPAPFASSFVGAVDLTRVGTMGHSRGGDGVVTHYSLFHTSNAYTVRAVLPIAPTNFVGSNASNVSLGVLLGYCDGDVNTLEGSLFYDRARYLSPGDETAKYTFLSRGSNHNFFNSVWTPSCWQTPGSCWPDARGAMPGDSATTDDVDDPETSCAAGAPGRLTPADQRAVGQAYVAAFFRQHVGNEPDFAPLLRGDTRPPGALPNDTFAGYQPPSSRRLDLNRLADASELTQTTLVGTGGLHGTVGSSGFDSFARCGFDRAHPCFPGALREVHLSNIAMLDPGLSRLRNAWSTPAATFSNDFPAGARDVRRFDTLQFRAGVDYTDTRAPVSSLTSLSVTLSDGSRSATVLTGADLGNHELFFPTGVFEPSTVMNTLRIPLSLFTGIDLSDVRRLTFRYDQTPAGTILVSDIAFADDLEVSSPRCQASESFVVGDRSKVTTPTGVAALYNAGSGISQLGRNAITDGIVSVGNVEILERGLVRGDVVSSGTIRLLAGAVVAGARSPMRPVSLPAFPVLPAFPASSGTVNVNPGPAVSLAPGSRVAVNVNGGFLKLSPGDYFFQALTINSSSRVEVTPRTRLFVRDTLAVRSSFVTPGNTLESVFLGFTGTSDLPLEAPFQGTLVAPNARVTLGTSTASSFSGAFFARIINVRNDATLVCSDGPGLGAPQAPTCSDGVRNGSETAVDCGGPICVDCLAGQACTTGSDCASGICANSICQPALGSVTATRTVTSDWPGGYCVSLLVRNNSTLPTSNFTVNLSTNQSTLYTSWNGMFSGSSGNLTVKPSFSWNKVIAPGATDSSIGFCANRAVSGSGVLPTISSASGTF